MTSGDAPESGQRARVLYVDDSEDLCASVSRLLSRLHDVTTASSGAEGLERLRAPGAAYDVVFCDLVMPEMNGIEFFRQATQSHPALSAGLVFISGGSKDLEVTEFLATSSNTLLEKPVSRAELLAIIEARLRPTRIDSAS